MLLALILFGVFCLMVYVVIYALCVMAGEVDRETENFFRELGNAHTDNRNDGKRQDHVG